MALNKLEERKLIFLKKCFSAMTSAEALQLAIEYEEQKRAVSPQDHAFSWFNYRQAGFETYALLLEKEEQS